MIRKAIKFPEEMAQKVEDIRKKNSLPSFTAAVHFAIAVMHAKDNPAYMALKVNETAEDRVRRKAEEKKTKEELVREEKLLILEALGGKLVVEPGGNEVCVYYTYSGKSRFEQTVSLGMLSDDLVKTQYQPNRAKVEQLQAEGKVNY